MNPTAFLLTALLSALITLWLLYRLAVRYRYDLTTLALEVVVVMGLVRAIG